LWLNQRDLEEMPKGFILLAFLSVFYLNIAMLFLNYKMPYWIRQIEKPLVLIKRKN
jgi:hypothetical protein